MRLMENNIDMENRMRDLLRLLAEHSRGLSAANIATHLGVSRQSVYRIIERCNQSGYTVLQEDRRYRLPDRDRDLERLYFSLNRQQAHDLLAAVESVKTLTPFASQALEAVRQSLVGHNLGQQSTVYYHSYDEIDPQIYQTLVAAISEHQSLDLEYRSTQPKRPLTPHLFNPYGIVFWNGHYYLVGQSQSYSHKPNQGLMHLRLDRIQSAKPANSTQNTPPRPLTFAAVYFDPKDYVERSFGTFASGGQPEEIVLHFAAKHSKAAAEVQRHPSRRLELQADGSLLYSLTVPVSPEVVWWIASWEEVRVLQPLHLRQKVHEHCHRMAALNSN